MLPVEFKVDKSNSNSKEEKESTIKPLIKEEVLDETSLPRSASNEEDQDQTSDNQLDGAGSSVLQRRGLNNPHNLCYMNSVL